MNTKRETKAGSIGGETSEPAAQNYTTRPDSRPGDNNE